MNYSGEPIWDPFCGSGTLLCEALLCNLSKLHPNGLAINQLTNPRREYSFEYWNNFSKEEYENWANDYVKNSKIQFENYLKKTPKPFCYVGSDISSSAINASKSNWNNLVQSYHIEKGNKIYFYKGEFEKIMDRSLSHFVSPPILFSNLPYGVRLAKHLNSVYNRFNRLVKENQSKFLEVYIMDGSSDSHFLKIATSNGVKWESVIQFSNG